MSARIGFAGAGLSCAIVARELAEQGHRCTLFEKRPQVAGNCHTERDSGTGVMVHRYGAHVFHTGDPEVWEYVQRWGRFAPYVTRYKARIPSGVYSLPVNLHTINQFFGVQLNPAQAVEFMRGKIDASIAEPRTFEEQALRFVGRELYEAFFLGYTLKQWGIHPSRLPASILKRLPVRHDYNDNLFDHPFQGIPVDGYTALVRNILDHPAIEVRLGEALPPGESHGFRHLFWSGPLDAWFGLRHGRLGYRSLQFDWRREEGDHQGNCVITYPQLDVPYTRVIEHKHFAPWESHARTTYHVEHAQACGPDDEPFYPLRLVDDHRHLALYVEEAQAARRVTFIGRLATYRYLDMHVVVREALDCAREFLRRAQAGAAPPVFSRDPVTGAPPGLAATESGVAT